MSSEFVGRTGALRLYSYPLPRFTGLVGPFANNFAAGPSTNTTVPIAGIFVPWATIYSGGPGSVNVPITPKATGMIRIIGALSIKNNSASAESVSYQVVIGGTPLTYPAIPGNSIAAGGAEVIAIVAETVIGEALALGVTVNVQILVSSSSDTDVQLVLNNSTLSVEEVPLPTG